MPNPPDSLRERIVEMANLAIPMLHDSIEAFVQQDPTLARGVILSEPAVDAPDGADMVILNTCHIRAKAAEKV